MSTATNYEIKSSSSEFTEKIGEQIGKNLIGNELLVLVSDLGGGKTSLTKGIAKGAGSQDLVSSPSFTLSNEYKTKNYLIAHYDFYRLNDPGVLLDSIIEDIADNKKVVIIEWPDIVLQNLPDKKIIIEIQTLTEHTRKLKMQMKDELNYLVKGLDELSVY